MIIDIYNIVGSGGKYFAVPAGTDVENPTNLPQPARDYLAGLGNVAVHQKDRDIARHPLPGSMQAAAPHEIGTKGIYLMEGSVE